MPRMLLADGVTEWPRSISAQKCLLLGHLADMLQDGSDVCFR